MKSTVIQPEQFEKAVMQALAKYGDDASEVLETVTKEATRGVISVLKSSAPSGGKYARGWSHKYTKGGRYRLSDVVYNRTDYQLTHLLEKAHPTGGGSVPEGHYPKNVDYTGTIADVEEKYSEWYMEEVLRRL